MTDDSDDTRLQKTISPEDKAALRHLEHDLKLLIAKYNIRALCLIAQPEADPNMGFSLIAFNDSVPHGAASQTLIDSLAKLHHGVQRMDAGIATELEELRAQLAGTKN